MKNLQQANERSMRRVAMRGHSTAYANRSDEYLRLADAWLREYVAVGDRRVGRSGPVCPFMPRALDQHAVETRIRYDINGSSEPELINELRTEIGEFGSVPRTPHKSGVLLDSRLIVMPHLGTEGWECLDAAYVYLKGFAVGLGLMVGQFHPRCDERAVRNSDFRVSVAPVAMLAIRHMAPHDILFLNRSERWFKEYDSHFRSHFERGRIRDSLLVSLYSNARDRFAAAGWQAEPRGRSSAGDDTAAEQSSSQ